MRNRSTRLTLVLLLSILMVLSTVPLQPEYTINDPVIQDSKIDNGNSEPLICLLYTSPSPRDRG